MCNDILLFFLFLTSVQAQLNGEFWWLNSRLNNLKKVQPPPPKIEVSDFENDESAKIIFRDDDLFSDKLKPIRDRTSKLMPIGNSNENKIVWPTDQDQHMKNHDVIVSNINDMKKTEELIKPSNIQIKNEDVVVFNYPKNEKYVNNELNNGNTESVQVTSAQIAIKENESYGISTEVPFGADKLTTATMNDKESQNICTYTKRKRCDELNGFVYEYTKKIPTTSGDEPLVCCILPVQPILDSDNLSHTIHFPRTASNFNRYKRSDEEANIALNLKQRDFLLKQKFSTRHNVKPVSTPFTKIVTPPEDDYIDPYWNIKNTKFQTPMKPNHESTNYDYYSEDNDQEYSDELPKPGLIGLYSDHAKMPSSWSFAGGNKGFAYGGSDDEYDEVDEDDDDTFGYSTIDPRQGNKKQKGKPSKFTTTSDDVIYDAESHTINFQSNPDFHVFQGFKLLNLFRNTSRFHTKNTKKTSSHDQIPIKVEESRPEESDEYEAIFGANQIFDDCGKVAAKNEKERGNQFGEAGSGSHPWMTLVVLTKSRHNVLCYATLVHPRAAVTVADCVHGTAPGDVTVIAGLWDLNDQSRSKSRVATVHVHPRYKPGDVDNNLAVLYWMRPLKLSTNIQPACLGEPQIGDECKFFGWGGLDQGIQQPRSKWQRVTLRACSRHHGIRASTEAFCVSTPRRTVTGMGGPLICEMDGRSSIVGVVVSTGNGHVLSPVRDWTMKTANLISGD